MGGLRRGRPWPGVAGGRGVTEHELRQLRRGIDQLLEATSRDYSVWDLYQPELDPMLE